MFNSGQLWQQSFQGMGLGFPITAHQLYAFLLFFWKMYIYIYIYIYIAACALCGGITNQTQNQNNVWYFLDKIAPSYGYSWTTAKPQNLEDVWFEFEHSYFVHLVLSHPNSDFLYRDQELVHNPWIASRVIPSPPPGGFLLPFVNILNSLGRLAVW